MNIRKIRSLKAGRELDVLVAERVMGLVPCQAEIHNPDHKYYIAGPCHARPEYPEDGSDTHSYSTDIDAMWEVIVELQEQGHWVGIYTSKKPGKFDVVYLSTTRFEIFEATDAPLGVCKAALLATIE